MSHRTTLMNALAADDAASALRDLDQRGLLSSIIPELEAGRGFEQPALHYYDVLNHQVAAVAAFDEATGRGVRGEKLREAAAWMDIDASIDDEIDGLPLTGVLKLACLVHDIAKPATATMVDGRLRFPRHGPEGALLLMERLPKVGFGEATTDLVARLVRQHLRPAELVRNHPVTDKAVRKFTADVNGQVVGLMLLNLSDGWATRGPEYTDGHFERHCGFLNYVVARCWMVTQPGEGSLVSGEDLMSEMGLESGRLLGAVLTSIRRAQLEGHITSRDERWRWRVICLRAQRASGRPHAEEKQPWARCGESFSTRCSLRAPSTSFSCSRC